MGGINDATTDEWDLAAVASRKDLASKIEYDVEKNKRKQRQAYQSLHALSTQKEIEEEIENAATTEAVDHPPHYANGEIETIDYIVDVLGKYEAIAYCQGNIIKYTGSRMWTKGNPIQDAKKARWYLNKMIWLLNETKGVNW